MLAWGETDNRDARVREQVFSAIGENLDELLPDDVDQLVTEEVDERVRFRLALDLSGRSSDAAAERRALVRLLDRGVEDPWLRIAVGTMKSDPPQALVSDILDRWMTLKKPVTGAANLIEQLCEIAGVQLDPKAARPLLAKILEFAPLDWGDASTDIRAAGVRGLGLGAARHGFSLNAVRAELTPADGSQLSDLMRTLQRSRSIRRQTPDEGWLQFEQFPTESDGRRFDIARSAFSDSEIPIKLAAFDVRVHFRNRQSPHD